MTHFFGERLKEDHLSHLIGNFLCLLRIVSHVSAFDGVVCRGERQTRRREKKKNYRLKLGWKSFTTAFFEKHSVQIKQVPVCEECNNRFRGTFPSFSRCFFLFSFFLICLAFCHLLCAELAVHFWGRSLPSFATTSPSRFSFSLFMSLRYSPL